jgi:hypothetical protein
MSLLNRNKTEKLPIDLETGSVDTAAVERQRTDLASSQPVGHRHPHVSTAQRPTGPAAYRATLVRGISHYITGVARFERGKPVDIDQRLFDYLRDDVDVLTYQMDGAAYRRFKRRFSFADMDGKPVDLPEIADEPAGVAGNDPFERAENARQIAG